MAWANFYNEHEGVSCGYVDVAISHDGGATWDVVTDPENPDYCTESAPFATYDPTTNIYVVFMNARQTHGAQYVTFDSNGNELFEALSSPTNDIGAVQTPTADCGIVTSGVPCLMAYGRNDAYDCLASRSFSINPTTGVLNLGTEVVQCFAQEFSPAVRFTANTASNPWVLVYKEVDALRSLVKPHGGGSWTNSRLLVNDPTNGVSSAALGLGSNGITHTVYAYAGTVP